MLVTTIILSFFFGIAINVEAGKCDYKTYYKEWNKLSKTKRKQAKKLKWNKKNWNLAVGPNIMTTLPYTSVIKTPENKNEINNEWGKFEPINKQKLKKTFKKMNLKIKGKECYDKYISHYAGYSWSDLENEPKEAYATLGWDEESWDGVSDNVPDYTCLYYSDLNKEQKEMMTIVGYPQLEYGGNWRWDEFPSTSLERSEECNDYRCSLYPEQYTEQCRFKYDFSPYCDEDGDEYESGEYKYFYETVGEDCVAIDKCATYGDYYVCENAFVKDWCEYDCVVFDQCQCESPSKYCLDYPDFYKTDEAESTCVPKEWCEIFLGYYESDYDRVVTDYFQPMMENCPS